MNRTNSPTRTEIKARLLGSLVVLVFVLSFLACSKEGKDQPETVEPKPVPPPVHEAAPVPPVPPPPPVAPEPRVAATEPPKAAEPVSPPPEPATPVERVAQPLTAVGNWTVQVGSFVQKSNASRMLKTLQSKSYQAYVVEAIVGGKTHHRVRVGRFATQKEAQALEKTVASKEGFGDAFVVRQAAGQAARKKS